MDHLQHLARARRAVGQPHPLHLEPECHVLQHRHVREQCILLKHGVDRAMVGIKPGNIAPKQPNLALVQILKPRDATQKRGLAAARRAQEGEEFIVGNLKRDGMQRRGRAIALYRRSDLDRR